MLFSVDRLQFINNKLVAYEFVDFTKPKSFDLLFYKEKIKVISNRDFSDEFNLVQYNERQVGVGAGESKQRMDYNDFATWFKQKNNQSGQNDGASYSFSKPLGSATVRMGDPYVQGLLNEVYADSFPQLNFDDDDNGLGIVNQILKNKNTYGFDFDLFESASRVVIEFLKRENEFVTNLTSHPARYAKNKRKFVSLWNAAKRVNGGSPNLFLVNYSDNTKEPIQLVAVQDFDTDLNNNKMVIADIGYKLTGRRELLDWLKLLNEKPTMALGYLDGLPKQVRDRDFFKQLYASSKKSTIGEHYE